MPTLNAGQTTTFTLAGFQTFTATSAPNSEWSYSAVPLGGSNLDMKSAGKFGPPAVQGKTFGPFGQSVTVTLTCSLGSVDYSAATNDAATSQAVRAAAGSIPQNYLGLLGDSISARWINSTDPTNVYTQPWGFVKWALELSGCFVRVRTAATPSTGMTPVSSGVTPTFQTQRDSLIGAGVTHCTFMGGVNDIQADATLAQLQSAATDIVDSLVAAGIRVYWCTIPPMSSTYGNYTTARQSVLLAYNDWIRRQCAQYGKRVRLVDLFKAVVDPASKTCSMLASATSDKLHPINWGAYYMGKELSSAWSNDGVPKLPVLISSAGDAQVDESGTALFSGATNILQNGLFNLGTPSGGVAQNWTQSNTGATCTPTIVAAPTGIGSAQQLACTFTASGQSCQLTSSNFASRVNLTGSVLVSLGLSVSSPSNLKNLRVRLRGFGNINPQFVWSQADGTDIALPEAWTGTVMFLYDMPPGLTALGGGMTLDVLAESAGTGSATIQVYQVSVRSFAAGA